jgi:hypothetical protein
MPLREEGVSLRFASDIAGLRAGKREVQEWSKEVERLSTLVKRGLAKPEDINRLREFQETAKRGYDALETKLQSYQERRERYLSQVGVAPTAAARLQAMGGARGAQEVQYQIAKQQQELQRLGAAAAPPTAPGMSVGGVVGGAAGMARRIPVIGGMLGIAGMAGYAIGAYRAFGAVERQAQNIALQFDRSGDNLQGMTRWARELGREFKFTADESVRAATAMMAVGGGRMAGPMGAEVMRFARARGVDPGQLGGLVGAMVRGGALAPGVREEKIMAFMESARLQTGRNPQALQQYMQNILPFLQSEGRFQPFVGRNLVAATSLQSSMVRAAGIPEMGPLTQEAQGREEFIRRSMPGILSAVSGGMRDPQSPAAQYFMMRTIGGFGDPGVTYMQARRRMQRGLTPENLVRLSQRMRGMGQETFWAAAQAAFGIPIEQAEVLRRGMANLVVGTPQDMIMKAERTIAKMEESREMTPAENLRSIDSSLDKIKQQLGEGLVTGISGNIASIAEAVNQMVERITAEPEGPPEQFRVGRRGRIYRVRTDMAEGEAEAEE